MSTAREQHEVDETKASHVLAWIKELLNYGGLRDDAESVPDQVNREVKSFKLSWNLRKV